MVRSARSISVTIVLVVPLGPIPLVMKRDYIRGMLNPLSMAVLVVAGLGVMRVAFLFCVYMSRFICFIDYIS